MVHTIQIDDTNSKAKALLEYLKTLDFVKLTDNSDWYDELSQTNKNSILQGLDNIRNSKVQSDLDVRNSISHKFYGV
jgi:hypothetical protein